jgi:hypothetical protein
MKPEDVTRLHYEAIESLYEDTSYLHSDISKYGKREKEKE